MSSSQTPKRTWLLWLVLLTAGGAPAAAFQLGSQPAAEWIPHLERHERVAALQIDLIVKDLNLKPGMVVADIGSGSGVFTRPLAKAVAPSGKAIAVDIDAALLSYVSESAGREKIHNIETHLAPPDDAALSGPVVDLAFFHDALHHIAHRDVYLENLAKYIKPAGRIAVIENDSNDPINPHRNTPEMVITKEQVRGWMAAAGFYPVQEFDLSPRRNWFILYARR